MIPYGRQNIDQADIDALVSVLKSDFLTQGPAIEKFEKEMAKSCQAKYSVAVSNATAALHIACLATDLGREDLLWTSPNSFVASANCGLYCQAQVDFVDIDDRTYNMSEIALEDKLISAKKRGRLPKVVIPVHFAGQSPALERIQELSKEYGFKIIEDASHAVGASYKGQPVGSSAFSDMTVFSFHPVKIMTTGEGGMILTNNEEFYQRLLRLRSHGITRNPELMIRGTPVNSKNAGPQESIPPWHYEQLDLGYNYRITDLQAALGSSQLKRLGSFLEKRREIVETYNDSFRDLPVVRPWQNPESDSAHHLYVLKIKNRDAVFKKMRDQQIGVNVHYIPIHTQPYYKNLGFKDGDFPVAEKYFEEAMSLPIYYGLSKDDQSKVIEALKKSLDL